MKTRNVDPLCGEPSRACPRSSSFFFFFQRDERVGTAVPSRGSPLVPRVQLVRKPKKGPRFFRALLRRGVSRSRKKKARATRPRPIDRFPFTIFLAARTTTCWHLSRRREKEEGARKGSIRSSGTRALSSLLRDPGTHAYG